MSTSEAELLDDGEWGAFAKGAAACPVCREQVPIPVEARAFFDDEGNQRIETRADMAELWSHMWGHENATAQQDG